ncbi:MAG: NAD-dependent epimerase/dehydratase family protein [Bacteroidota bacterium]|nr:NAD-dependent epimerase/dehydratase family protein [Flavisolibacter sp.]MDQ3844916.1 NAD-dependent epimerase/dehydratase family protein [Bacteroidota bacterium]
MNTLRNKNILVTGGAGFIGSNLVKALVNQHGAHVTVLDDLFTGDLAHLEGIKHRFVQGSVEDAQLVNECVSNADIVFHLASRNIIVSNQNPREDLSVNVSGGFNVFEACLLHKVARVVYASTSSVYGNPERLPVSEEDRKDFLNFYSASKFSAEVYAQTFYEVFQLPITIVRYSNVYGPHQSPTNPYCGVIGKFIKAALSDQALFIHGDGEHTRDYTYVDDAVKATIAAALYPVAVGEAYNIGTGIETSVNELADTILTVTKSASSIEYVENRDIDNICRRVINIAKAKSDLRYQPEHTIKKGLQKTIDWFLHSYERVVGLMVVVSIMA